nr:hypothetical protein [Tanacetum cinerariifolium]
MPERHVSPTPYDVMLTRWRSRVASRSSLPTTSTLEFPTAPIPPAPSAVVVPSSDIISHVDAPLEIRHFLTGHTPPDTTVADSSTPPRFVYPPLDRDVKAGVNAGIGMEVDVGVDIEDEVESSDKGTIEIGVDVVAWIDIPGGMLMPDVVEHLEQVEEVVQEIYDHVMEIPLQRVEDIKMGQRELERSNARLRGTVMMESARADRFWRRMGFMKSELRQIRRTPRCSEAYRRWRSAPLSTMYPPATSESSAKDSSFESSAGPSRKRCRSPVAIRFRDYISSEDSVEEDIATDVLANIKTSATAVEVVVDRDVKAGVNAGIGMEVDVGVDIEDEVESSDKGTIEIGVDVVAWIDIPGGMLMPDVVEHLEQVEEVVQEKVRSLIAGRE